ncbi:MAG TPA: DUF3786 domain-containing protein [Sumerlaeia bacterium]|nr:DUF3786 domain-containing protein [Sumerlaeia bacterium]
MKSPPKQNPYQESFSRALEVVRGRQSADLEALGAVQTAAGQWGLPVLDGVFLIDLGEETVRHRSAQGAGAAAAEVRTKWQILALHYLSAPGPRQDPAAARADPAWGTFADLPHGRGYDPVHRGRVLGRLCATAGRDRATFVEACRRLGAEEVDLGEAGFRFRVFPRLAVAIAWYAGDDEFSPNASFLYPENVLSFLPVEDAVVLAECVISRLQGKPW